jgi:transcriptional regulator with XRE-family HTH domain
MKAGSLVREARRRAGLTQAELATRAGTTQSSIARLESGRTEPSMRRVQQILRECGVELKVRLAPTDDSDWSLALENLSRTPDQRVRQNQAAVRFASAGRAALAARG